jgi:hypothetical protein
MSEEQQSIEKLQELMSKRTRIEKLFLNSEAGNGVKNRHNVFIYQSSCGKHLLKLDHFLADYKEWLIENKFVKEI